MAVVVGKPKFWIRIQDGAQLRVGVSSEDARWTAVARVVDDKGNVTVFGDSKLPGSMPLRSPRVYAISIDVIFTGSATITVEAQLTKPDGSVHGTVYSEEYKGTKGDSVRIPMTAATVKKP